MPFSVPDSYESATRFWKTPEDIAAWIEGNFVYDKGRAVGFSETRRRGEGEAHVYTPSEFFPIKRGVCVDLARFAVESLKVVDPATNPKYVMIEFEPVRIGEDILRFHWLVSFRREGKAYFFADSERPGYAVGPYNNTREFIQEYEQYRGRRIARYKELESYQKARRIMAPRPQS